MFVFLFLVGFLAFLYFRETPIRISQYLPPWIEFIVIGITIALVLRGIENQLFGTSMEGFQDEILQVDISDAFSSDVDKTQLITELFNKYKDLLQKYATVKGGATVSDIECKTKLKEVQTKLDLAIKEHQKYRTRLKLSIPDMIAKNYIRKSKVDEFIDSKCNFGLYDVTKHPDFKNKCADPKYFEISKHKDYNRVTDEYIRKGRNTQKCPTLDSFDVTKHAKFTSECNKNMAQLSEKTVKLTEKNTQLTNEKAKLVSEKTKLVGEKAKLVGEKAKLVSEKAMEKAKLTSEKKKLVAEKKALANKTEQLVDENVNLLVQLEGKALGQNGFRVRTTKDCPNLESLLRQVKKQVGLN